MDGWTPMPEPMPAPLLELCAVTRQYRGGGLFRRGEAFCAVDGVSLPVFRGEVLGLVGESGCGKSTLSRLMLGLERPSAGTVLFDGQPIDRLNRRALARRVQPVFQDPYSSLNPRHTVGEILTRPLHLHRLGGPAQWRASVEAMLDTVALPRRVRDSYPSQLSGGQRQRVAIARALIMRPELVICDEPTSALDISVQSQILNLLMDLRREFGLTYVLISHNLAVVEHMATRTAVMYRGRIVELTATAALFDAPRHPYTRSLLQSVLTPEPGLGLPDDPLGGAALRQPSSGSSSGCAFHPRCRTALPVCSDRRPAPSPRPSAQRGAGGPEHVECHLA